MSITISDNFWGHSVETLLIQTTNRKWCMACQLVPFPMTCKDIRLLPLF